MDLLPFLPARRLPARRLVRAAWLAASFLWPSGAARGDSLAYFWLSNSDAGPEVPTLFVPPSSQGEVAIWARPQTNYRLSAFSLDLVATTPGIAQFSSVSVNNPLLQSPPPEYRHQVVFDSASGLFVTPNEINNFLGYSFFDGIGGLPDGVGIGPLCGLDPDCSTASGQPTWQIASVTFNTPASYGSTELFLRIGTQGLWQSPANATDPDPPTDTSAVFGLTNDTPNQWTVPSVGGTDHRGTITVVGAVDAVVVIATADFNQDGEVNGADFLRWQRGLGSGMTLATGDADDDNDVDAIDLAAWQYQFGTLTAATPVGSAIPEPTGALLAAGAFSLLGRLIPRRQRPGPDQTESQLANAASQANSPPATAASSSSAS